MTSTAMREFAADFVADLCQRLIDGGAPGLHFYTLNLVQTDAERADSPSLITV